MKKYTTIIGLLMISAGLNSQWVSNYWGNDQGDNPILNSVGMAVTSDNHSNSYVTGYTFDSYTNNDIILIKYDSDGDTAFVRVYNGTANGEDKAFGIVVDEDGNIYVIGQTEVDGKGLELILIKYNSYGNLTWVRTYGATNAMKDDVGMAAAIDDNDNIYVTGYVTRSESNKEIVIIKYRPDGTIDWLKTEDGEGGSECEGLDIAVDNDNYVYITGYTTSMNNAAETDIITQKYAANGVLKWTGIYNGEQNEEDKAFGITIDDADNVYVTGYTTIDRTPMNTSAVTIKYRKNGDRKWVKLIESGIEGSLDKAFGITLDDERIYITGQKANQNNNLDYFTARYNRAGVVVWLSPYDGPAHGIDYSNAITVLHNGKIAVTGASWGLDNNLDYATLILDKNNGEIHVAHRYGMTPNSNDIAEDIASTDNDIFVTGYSELAQYSAGGPSAISTLKYLGGESEDIQNTNTPINYGLHQNFPNPFNPTTTIKFDIAEKSHVKLVVYDMLGKTVDVIVDQELGAGNYSITYKNSNLSSGIYFYQLTAGNFTDVKRMSLIK